MNPSAFDRLKERWRKRIVQVPKRYLNHPIVKSRSDEIARKATAAAKDMDRSSGRSLLWKDLPNMRYDFDVAHSFSRLHGMALAHELESSSMRGCSDLLEITLDGLGWLMENIYRVPFDIERHPVSGAWYHEQIGIPNTLSSTCLLLSRFLPAETVGSWCSTIDHHCRLDGRTYEFWAANRVWRANAIAQRGVVGQDASAISRARDSLTDTGVGRGEQSVFAYVSHGDGFYRDGSFIQHEVFPYTGSYGSGLLNHLVPLLGLLSDSPWQLNESESDHVDEWLTTHFLPVMTDTGLMMDFVRGRSVSRCSEGPEKTGAGVLCSILAYAETRPEKRRNELRSIVRRALSLRAPLATYAPAMGDLVRVLDLAEDGGVATSPRRGKSHIFARMDRAAHHRPEWSFAISMHSTRTANFEYTYSTREHIRGWHTADGMTYLYTGETDQFTDAFWPLINPKRLPGTTVDTQERKEADGAKSLGKNEWAGGATDGNISVVGQALEAWNHLSARKSWFCLEDCVVCLGSGIAGRCGESVETIVENRALFSPENMPLAQGTGKGLTWMHLEHPDPANAIGYLFLPGTSPQSRRVTNRGAWGDVNGTHQDPEKKEMSRVFQEIWVSHGVDPTEAGYGYAIIPCISRIGLESIAKAPPFEVLRADNIGHVLRWRDYILANIWESREVDLDGQLCARGPLSILIHRRPGETVVTVADPTQSGRPSMWEYAEDGRQEHSLPPMGKGVSAQLILGRR